MSIGVVGFLALAVEPVFQLLFPKLFSPRLPLDSSMLNSCNLQDNVRLLLVISTARS